jgi:RNA polymerase sigma-70 factor (ECF subfamily)
MRKPSQPTVRRSLAAPLAELPGLPGAGELTDEEVARRVLAGERELFELLMRRYNRRFYRIVRAVVLDDAEAEDVLQEVWLRAYEHLGQFDGRARLSTWLARIALHTAFARRRRASRFQQLGSPARVGAASAESGEDGNSAEENLPAAGLDPERLAASSELGALLVHELERLPEEARTVFVLRAVEELSTAETAAALGIQEAAVKVRLHRARHRLRDALDRRFDRATRELWGFLGERCDRVVRTVMPQLASVRPTTALPPGA